MQPSPAWTAVVNAVIYVVERLCQGEELVLKSRSFSFYPDLKRLLQCIKVLEPVVQAAVKNPDVGRCALTASPPVTWSHSPASFPAIIEHVRDGSVVRALLLPDYYLVTVMLSGIKVKTPTPGAEL